MFITDSSLFNALDLLKKLKYTFFIYGLGILIIFVLKIFNTTSNIYLGKTIQLKISFIDDIW